MINTTGQGVTQVLGLNGPTVMSLPPITSAAIASAAKNIASTMNTKFFRDSRIIIGYWLLVVGCRQLMLSISDLRSQISDLMSQISHLTVSPPKMSKLFRKYIPGQLH